MLIYPGLSRKRSGVFSDVMMSPGERFFLHKHHKLGQHDEMRQ